VAVVVVLRSRRDREAWEIGLEIPFAISVDLLSVLLVARWMTLEQACVGLRVLWLVGGAGDLIWRRRTGRAMPAWPRALSVRDLVVVAAAVAFGVWLSAGISHACINSDRRWHIPLVGSMRGQTAPFHNVYDPIGTLGYHLAGDAFAAMVQALSGDVLHSSLALSISHDILFGLAAAALALLLVGRGLGGALLAVLAVAAFLLSGPSTILNGTPEQRFADAGYSYVAFLRVSFRPPVALEAVLLIGFLGAVVVRLWRTPGEHPRARVAPTATWPVLVACTAALSLTDEATIGLSGLALGGAWLVAPGTLHPRRRVGLWILAALLAALVLPCMLVGGSFAPGAPHQPVSLTPWRIIGYHRAPLLLSIPAGRKELLGDMHSITLVWLAGAWACLRIRRRGFLGLFALFTALAAASLLALMRVQVSAEQEEGHRFMTGIMLATPLFACLFTARARGIVVPALALGSLGLSAASTVHWRREVQPKHYCDSQRVLGTNEPLHDTDCRKRMGARFGEAATPEYVAGSLAYWYDGCHPVFAPTEKLRGNHWTTSMGYPVSGKPALAVLHRQWMKPDATLLAICPPHEQVDPICKLALARGRCTPLNDAAVTCKLSPVDREVLLADVAEQ
jgi:hypothetical protein